MPLFEAVRLALDTIRAQKLKSFFTLIGVTIGVMFLIAVVSIVEGMGRYVEEDFAGKFLGVNTFNLRRYPDINMGEVTDAMWREWQRRPPVTEHDALAVRASLPEGTRWAIQDINWLTPTSVFTDGGPQVITQAVTSDFFAIKNLVVERGRVFTEQEELAGVPVVVIGKEVAEHYFPNLDPLGRELRFKGFPFRVIGVPEKQGSVFGMSLDQQAIAPFSSPMRRFVGGRQNLSGIVVQASTEQALAETQELVREVMRRRRGLRP